MRKEEDFKVGGLFFKCSIDAPSCIWERTETSTNLFLLPKPSVSCNNLWCNFTCSLTSPCLSASFTEQRALKLLCTQPVRDNAAWDDFSTHAAAEACIYLETVHKITALKSIIACAPPVSVMKYNSCLSSGSFPLPDNITISASQTDMFSSPSSTGCNW